MNVQDAQHGAKHNVQSQRTSTEASAPRREDEATQAPAARRPTPVVATGQAVGGAVASGVCHFIASAKDLDAFRPGEVLMADFTTPEWQPAMATAAAIITNRGGRKSHAAVLARRMGVPAIVGTVDGASNLWTGAFLTVSCAEGAVGRVYEVPFPPAP